MWPNRAGAAPRRWRSTRTVVIWGNIPPSVQPASGFPWLIGVFSNVRSSREWHELGLYTPSASSMSLLDFRFGFLSDRARPGRFIQNSGCCRRSTPDTKPCLRPLALHDRADSCRRVGCFSSKTGADCHTSGDKISRSATPNISRRCVGNADEASSSAQLASHW